jgi:hypothetical protein
MFEVRQKEMPFACRSPAAAARIHVAAKIASAAQPCGLRVAEAPDESRRTLGVAVERGEKLISSHSGLQCLGL